MEQLATHDVLVSPPLMRIFTFGGVTLEQLASAPSDPTPRYQRISHDVWQSRGPALTMLKYLVSRPVLAARQATQEELIDAIWTEDDQQRMGDVEKALRAAASVLRKVLTPECSTESLLLIIPGTGGESTIYKLAGQDRLWIDANHFEGLVARAIRTSDVQTVLSLWQEASGLYRGVFLDSNRYQDWSQARRESLEADYRRMVLYVADLHVQTGDMQMADELLQPFVALHPTDQDALYLLLSVLEHQGQYHAAWRLYRRARRQEGQQDQPLSPRLHAIAKRLHEHLRTPAQPLLMRAHINWGEAPQAVPLYGREQDLSILSSWITQEHARLVAVVGMAGIGKTSIVVNLVEQVKSGFDYVIWRSLQNAPPLHTLLEQCLIFFSGEQITEVPRDEESQMVLLLSLLQQHRCLLILDRVESLFQPETYAGTYREGYAGYGMLLSGLGEARHQSCVLLISRELSRDVTLLEGKHPSVHVYQLEGLQPEDGMLLLKEKGVTGLDEVQQEIVLLYDGNPLLLILAAQYLHDVYHGGCKPFARNGVMITDEMREIFNQQFERLSVAERELLIRAVKEPDGMTLTTLQEHYADERQEKRAMQAALRSLQWRSLVKMRAPGFAISKVLRISITEHLAEQHMLASFSHTPAQNIIDATKQSSGPQDMDPSRRGFLQTLGLLGTEFLAAPRLPGYGLFIGNHSPKLSQASVAHLATITQQFRAMQRLGDVFITDGVNTHIHTVQEALEHALDDSLRSALWRVLAQTQIVAGFDPTKKMGRGRAKTCLEAAIASAQNSGDALLTGAALGHLAHFALREEKNIIKASQLLGRAQEMCKGPHPLNGWFALIMASIAAKTGYQQQCEAYLTDAMAIAHDLPHLPDYSDIYFTDFSLISVQVFTVNCWLTLGNASKAYTHLAMINLEDLADNRRASAFSDASKACMMMGEFEIAQRLAFQAIDKALATHQQYVIPRCMALAQTIQKKEPENHYASAITDYARHALQHYKGEEA